LIKGDLKARGIGVTRVTLQPLCEEDISTYVATTMSREIDDIVPLSAVIQAKTGGNPFLIREMLTACHRKNCIWYDSTKQGMWKYDIDRIFQHFSTDKYNDVLNNDFVTRRLEELPPASRSILSWASLIGTSFSFELVQRLMSGEFDFKDEIAGSEAQAGSRLPSHSQKEAVAGLQAAIQAYIIVATDDDDRFRFAHDRYIQASTCLRPEGAKMHFIIAETLLKYYSLDEKSQTVAASHICDSIDIITKRVKHRKSFRKLLFDCAQTAAERGARPTAVKLYSACFSLLQDDPWDGEEDVDYEETLSLYLRAAECYHYLGLSNDAMRLLTVCFHRARTPIDKAPVYVLQSRLYSQRGDSSAAFHSLRACLIALGIEVDENPTWGKCDAEFERLSLKIQSTDRKEVLGRKLETEPGLSAMGAVLSEITSAAYWSDPLTFAMMTLVFVNTHFKYGGFPQSGLCFIYLAAVAVTRYNMVAFACEIGLMSLDLVDRWHDPYTMGRVGIIYSLFVGHFQSSLPVSIGQLEAALEHNIQGGDRISTILNFGVVALLKFFASEDLAELELFCYGPEEIPQNFLDSRGGSILIAVRQVCRALQGKTATHSAVDVMSDDTHSTDLYLSWIKTTTVNSDRPIWIYETLEVSVLFLYGHYERAVEKGKHCIVVNDDGWSARNSRFMLFFYGLAIAGVEWSRIQDPRNPVGSSALSQGIEITLNELKSIRKKLLDWQTVSDVNYFSWSSMINAQIAEIQGEHGTALHSYEEALDHAVNNSAVFEEALGNYLLAGFFVRRGARRSAKGALREAVMLYRQFGAVGIAKHIEEEHVLLLQGPTKNLRSADVGVQVDFAGDSANVQYQGIDGDDERQQARGLITESKGDRIDAWQGGSARPDAGSGLPALDMLDLTSILESSQVISSVLQVDQLLTTMVEIILQNCGAVATLAAIIVEEDDPVPGWSIAASGDPENGAKAHIPGLPLTETPMVDDNIILYCTRFRETVFVPDLVRDERFSNVADSWYAANPHGKAIIAIPIAHGSKPLLGVLYLEGHPNAFTDRNLTVLQLLVNQIGISYSNALTLKAIEKVSASNKSMVQSQKRALAKAKEAEAKAKFAEAEALRNVKLAEEAAKAKSIFLANVSHELRTPLNGVIGNSELLRVSGELSKEQAEMSDSIRVSADLLLTVINDILDFSRMEADRMELFNVAFNAAEMLAEVVRSMSYSTTNKLREVEIRSEFDLPDTLIYGDPVRLHQVLGNLVGNSLKFTEKGSITVGARKDAETRDHIKLLFWVKDTGCGISPQNLPKLFKPFSQADASTARKYGGSGLGLSICKALIESMMHGKIELSSEVDVGTTVCFSVTFPKANSGASAGDSQNSEQRDPMAKYIEDSGSLSHTPYSDLSNIPRSELRICIAEDNKINQRIAIQIVQKLGFKYVDAYDNGLEAVEGLRRMAKADTPYHLVLMDCQMPVLDGYESTKLIRKDALDAVRGIVVIAMTASAIQGDREKCLDSGMNDYLAKPVRVHILKKKLEEYLHQVR
jgi:signal transduction histidine kinase/CheY-like chemotaxis protein/tetratricopeptide (TPR) repeat protein